MLTANAYLIASHLATGAFSLHDLLATAIDCDEVPDTEVDAYLRQYLRELAENGWISWEYEPDYGNQPSRRPSRYDVASFDIDWQRCTTNGSLRRGIPDVENPTMLIEATELLIAELDKPIYDGMYDDWKRKKKNLR